MGLLKPTTIHGLKFIATSWLIDVSQPSRRKGGGGGEDDFCLLYSWGCDEEGGEEHKKRQWEVEVEWWREREKRGDKTI